MPYRDEPPPTADTVDKPRARSWRDRIVEGAFPVLLGSLLAWLGHAYSATQDKIAAEHDELIVIREQLGEVRRVLNAIAGPRILPGQLAPALPAPKESPP